MKNFAVSNIEKRASVMLREHVDVLSGFGADLEWYGETYHMNMGNDLVFGTVGYDIRNKFLVKTYGMSFDVIFDEVRLSDSFSASCSFSGMTRIEGACFKVKKDDDGSISRLLNDSGFINNLIKLGESLDLESVKVEYSAGTGQLTFKIKPYAGVYLWLKFPPINRQIPLRDSELEALLKFTRYIKKHFSHKLYN